MSDPEATELAIVAARAADEKLASDIVVLDVGDVLGICDHFVVVSARNERQVKAVAVAIEDEVRNAVGRSPRGEEGLDARRWVLIDYGDVVIHVFLAEEREYYRLERLYGDVPRTPWQADADVAGGGAES